MAKAHRIALPRILSYTTGMDTNDLRPDQLVRYRELARRVCARQSTAVIARGMDKTPATIRKYMRDEAFQAILKAMDEDIWKDTMSTLKSAASQSIFAKAEEDSEAAYATLYDLMADTNASPHVRSRNAETILELAGVKDGKQGADDRRIAPLHASQLMILKDTIVQVAQARDNGPDDGKASDVIDVTPGANDGQQN